MTQRLSAINYLKNNKRRTSVLIVSLALFFVMSYLTNFLLSSTEETVSSILETTEKFQHIILAGSSLGIDIENVDPEEFFNEYSSKVLSLCENLEKHPGIEHAFFTSGVSFPISPPIGNMDFTIPLIEKEHILLFLNHFGAVLSKGKLPENPGEIVLDNRSVKNQNLELNQYWNSYKIVGILDCEGYFGCGIPFSDDTDNFIITVLSDGSIEDLSAILHEEGIDVRENYDSVMDRKWAKAWLKDEIVDVIDTSTEFIYIGALILLSIALIVVYTIYLRDRHNEWCLYCSIGYSQNAIYFSIMRELLFSFGAALLIGGILIFALVFVLDYFMLQANGLMCRYFSPETLFEILCSYMLILGILQIPIRYALYRIRTIDAIDDDLY